MSISNPSFGKENPFEKSDSSMQADFYNTINKLESQPLVSNNTSMNNGIGGTALATFY